METVNTSYATLRSMKLTEIKPKNHLDREISQNKMAHYPNFNIDLSSMPEAKKWEVGKIYMIQMKVRQTNMYMGKNGNGNAGFDILAIAGKNHKEPKVEQKPSKKYSRITK